MRLPWYLFLGIRQLFPAQRWISTFALMSILGVSLGVMILIVVPSVMNGVSQQVRSIIRGTKGDVQLLSSTPVYNWQSIGTDLLENNPNITSWAPMAFGNVMLMHNRVPAYPNVMGIELSQSDAILPLNQYIKEGSLGAIDDSRLIVSTGLARTLGLKIGDTLEVYTPLMLEKQKKDEVLLPRELEVGAIFESTWDELDNNFAFFTLRTMQELYGMPGGIHGITIRTPSKVNADLLAGTLNRSLSDSPLRAYSWYQLNADFLNILKLEKTMMYFITLFIIIVACFAITSSLMISVIRKTSEIGLLGALGARPSHIAYLFCIQGFIVGIFGCILGFLIALLGIYLRNDVVRTMALITANDIDFQRYYHLVNIPYYMDPSDTLFTLVMVIIVTTLAGLYPAYRASKLKPYRALRSQ